MERIFGLAALIGFVLSLAVHITALFGVDVAERFPFVWGLHIGLFIVFIPFVLSSRKTLGTKPSFAAVRALFPKWVIVVGIVVCAYAALNFLVFMNITEGGNPAIQDGKYVLLNHGKLIREITQAEYHSFRANEVRGFSGHWLVFYFVPFAYFMFHNKFNSTLKTDAVRRSA